MKEKLKVLQSLALDLNSQGFAREAQRLSRFIIKKALKIDVDFLNSVRDELGDSILEMEYYPPGAGLFPDKQEVGIFFRDLESELEIRKKVKSLGFDFQAMTSSVYFSSTISGASSKAAKTLDAPYYVLVITMEEKTPSV